MWVNMKYQDLVLKDGQFVGEFKTKNFSYC
jgi:hypothetical protein